MVYAVFLCIIFSCWHPSHTTGGIVYVIGSLYIPIYCHTSVSSLCKLWYLFLSIATDMEVLKLFQIPTYHRWYQHHLPKVPVAAVQHHYVTSPANPAIMISIKSIFDTVHVCIMHAIVCQKMVQKASSYPLYELDLAVNIIPLKERKT